MDITKAVKVALNTLVDIASHSGDGQLVPVPEIAKRQNLSISRIELLLRPLRESGLVVGVKGRTGGYQLKKDPGVITIKDIVLAMNLIKKRKVELSDIAKELYQSLETYMLSCMANVTLASTIKDYVPSFSEIKKAPERKIYIPQDPGKETKQKGDIQKIVKTEFKKIEQVPRGPNSVFDFANFLNRTPS
ncbi:Rrf2 family transcriptional regulator [Polynucleobacter sp. AP-Titi-500A-B4]|uniref:RrF2 family transcriptional regulator n=1 Tax=Polynucleobacter sp. AP-Titi-500A-B4 TaxID=2576923 RepID=UPI001BFE4810|nr:Rrf2 family transcriptional regulator [Polynucleobacter sp. AP-Titi-500A-B4]QWE12058.1 Rrf2 family transcriptional regulator [Polynucleobacter sp. AP-Titi-500A-B4]